MQLFHPIESLSILSDLLYVYISQL